MILIYESNKTFKIILFYIVKQATSMQSSRCCNDIYSIHYSPVCYTSFYFMTVFYSIAYKKKNNNKFWIWIKYMENDFYSLRWKKSASLNKANNKCVALKIYKTFDRHKKKELKMDFKFEFDLWMNNHITHNSYAEQHSGIVTLCCVLSAHNVNCCMKSFYGERDVSKPWSHLEFIMKFNKCANRQRKWVSVYLVWVGALACTVHAHTLHSRDEMQRAHKCVEYQSRLSLQRENDKNVFYTRLNAKYYYYYYYYHCMPLWSAVHCWVDDFYGQRQKKTHHNTAIRSNSVRYSSRAWFSSSFILHLFYI